MMNMSVRQIAEMYNLPAEVVRNLCSAREQRFAMKLVPRGRWYIDSERFGEFLERKQKRTRETRGRLR